MLACVPHLSPACSDLLQQYQLCSSREDILAAQKKWLEDDTYKGPKRDFPPTSSDSDSDNKGEHSSEGEGEGGVGEVPLQQ